MNLNTTISEQMSLVGVINPGAKAAGAYTTGWIPMATAEGLMALLSVGTMSASGTIDAKFQQATNLAGAGVKDVPGSAITQRTAAGGDSNKQVQVNIRRDRLDLANNFTHVRFSVTTAVAASDLGAVVFAGGNRFGDGGANDLATVVETVTF